MIIKVDHCYVICLQHVAVMLMVLQEVQVIVLVMEGSAHAVAVQWVEHVTRVMSAFMDSLMLDAIVSAQIIITMTFYNARD